MVAMLFLAAVAWSVGYWRGRTIEMCHWGKECCCGAVRRIPEDRWYDAYANPFSDPLNDEDTEA